MVALPWEIVLLGTLAAALAEAMVALTAPPWPLGSSDDRSPEAFRTRIEAATQMESVLGTGGRPNCLVIDEIDGAPTVGLLGVLQPGGQAVGAVTHRRLHVPPGRHQCSSERLGPPGPTGGRSRGPRCAHGRGAAAPGGKGDPDEAHHLHLQ